MRSALHAVSLVTVILGAGAALDRDAAAHWRRDGGANLPLGDRSGDQVQPKIRATPDGGSYVSWFDNSTGGYDVSLQRLDARGNEQWAHDGVLVADRGFSSTQDYGLAVDAAGNALLVFRDDRAGPARITAAKIAPDGTLLWGPDGVALTDGSESVAAPRVAATTDDHVVAAWSSDGVVRLQRLDADGVPQWDDGVTIVDSTGDGYSASDLQASNDGSVILAIVRGFFGANLLAQKIDVAGAFPWGETPLAVFDGGALQIANLPTFVPDGAGGAVFGWYGVSPLQCYVQRVSADGVELFPHDGVPASTNGSRNRVGPSVAFDAADQAVYLFWTELNSGQSMWGVWGQRFDAAGARQWGDTGQMLVPLGDVEITQVRTVALDDGAMALFVDKPSPPFGQRVMATRVDDAGDFVWPGEFVAASSVVAGKSRLDAVRDAAGAAILAWSDARTDGADVYGQNVNPTGVLGIPGDADDDGDVDFSDLLLVLAAWGECPPPDEPCLADANGDGSVDFTDILVTLANWG